MLARLLEQGVQIGWFTADEAYGDNPGLRAWLQTQQVNYVMAISCDAHFATSTGPVRADDLAAAARNVAGNASRAVPAARDSACMTGS
jgi:SRSO17 transposase